MNACKLYFNKIMFLIAITVTFSAVSSINARWQKKSWSSYQLGAGGTVFAFVCAGVSKQFIKEAYTGSNEVVACSLSGITAFLMSSYLFYWSYKSLERRQGCLDMVMGASFVGFIASIGYGVAEVAAGKIRGLAILSLGTASGAVGTLLAYRKFSKNRI